VRSFTEWKFVLLRLENWRALLRFFRIYDDPFRAILEQFGLVEVRLRRGVWTPRGKLPVTLGGLHDIATMHGIFARQDYRLSGAEKIVIDIGANIGLASLYFLSHSEAMVWAFEPVPRHEAIFRRNTAGFEERLRFTGAAIHTATGTVAFRSEETGKFGKVVGSEDEGADLHVPALRLNDVLAAAIDQFGIIDCIKIDTEGSEGALIASIDGEFWPKILRVYAENSNSSGVMPGYFRRAFVYNVESLTNERLAQVR
jgi:FkbM family methyltransferase